MKPVYSIVAATLGVLLIAGCDNNSGSGSASTTVSTNPADINNPLVNAKRTADKTIDVSYLNQAVQLFNVQEGRYPKTLEELTPRYVAQLPTPPLGYMLNYDAVKGEVTVVRK
jgi:outer membrane murein-binding lipoprotein Lpp